MLVTTFSLRKSVYELASASVPLLYVCKPVAAALHLDSMHWTYVLIIDCGVFWWICY